MTQAEEARMVEADAFLGEAIRVVAEVVTQGVEVDIPVVVVKAAEDAEVAETPSMSMGRKSCNRWQTRPEDVSSR